jgi:hypothetical protein
MRARVYVYAFVCDDDVGFLRSCFVACGLSWYFIYCLRKRGAFYCALYASIHRHRHTDINTNEKKESETTCGLPHHADHCSRASASVESRSHTFCLFCLGFPSRVAHRCRPCACYRGACLPHADSIPARRTLSRAAARSAKNKTRNQSMQTVRQHTPAVQRWKRRNACHQLERSSAFYPKVTCCVHTPNLSSLLLLLYSFVFLLLAWRFLSTRALTHPIPILPFFPACCCSSSLFVPQRAPTK